MSPTCRWRTGRKVGRTIYDDDKLVGIMDTPELAQAVVNALNREDVASMTGNSPRVSEVDAMILRGLVLRLIGAPGYSPTCAKADARAYLGVKP